MIISKHKNKLIFIIILFSAISIYFSNQLTIEDFRNNKLLIKDLIADNYILSVFLFFASCVIFINSPIPFAAIIKVLGGFFFGFYIGMAYNIIATVIACLVGFGISRYVFKEAFEQAYYERIKNVETEIEKNGFYYFMTLRLVMVVPYFLINIIAGISRISFKDYLLSTVLGVIPASLIYANGGNKLEQINSTAELFKSDVVISLSLVALFSMTPIMIKKYKTRNLG